MTTSAPSMAPHPLLSLPVRRPGLHRIVILGGGFGGFYTARNLEAILRKNPNVEITLLARDNYFLMTPFLFEAGSGVLEPRHAVNPIRRMLKTVRFIEADVERIDFEARRVYARQPPDHRHQLDYDQLVLALGGITNRRIIPGSEHALGFKNLADAIFIRNHLIGLFEQADVEEDQAAQQTLLTVVVIGGGLVGVELIGELTEFMTNLLPSYPHVRRECLRFLLIEAKDRIIPEMEEDLARYAAEVLRRHGVKLLTGTPVHRIEPDKVHLPPQAGDHGETVVAAGTILLAAGIAPNPLLADFPLAKARNGRILVDSTMRCSQRPDVWALGDCASIPDPAGNPYPPLAQHALREARVLAHNIATIAGSGTVSVPEHPPALQPFVYHTLGMLASLGHYRGVGRVGPFKVRGFFAWWVWRTYYVLQIPRWERRFRVILDWTVALLFRNDAVKLDLFGEEHPTQRPGSPTKDGAT